MFFFLSSYGLTARFVQQGQNYFRGYLRRRIWGVLFPFIIATLLYVTLLAADRHDASLFVKKFIDMATGTHTALPYSWFVFAIVIFYALFYVVFRLIKASMRVRIVICALCLAAYTAAFCLTGQGRGWWYTGFAFLAGMFFRLHEARLQSFYHQHICHILLPPVACAIIWALFQTHLAVLPVLAFVLIPTLLALLLSHFDLTRSAPLRFLGNISYEIYLMHGVWIVLLRGESVYINSTAIYVAAVFAATVASAWVLHLVSRR
jgi:peptidoglycan/LPS O-acetylase OafA/YrhL